MEKKKIIIILLTLLFFSSSSIPVTISANSIEKKSNSIQEPNHYSPEDEGAHFPCGNEWWMFYSTLELEDGTHWDASATFQYGAKQNEDGAEINNCVLLMYFFDRENKKCYDFSTSTHTEKPITFKRNAVEVKYHNNSFSGLYPEYVIHLESDEKTIILDIKMHATSLPHWAAEEGGGEGYFPWGIGIARYIYITSLDVSGTINITNKRSNVTGVGYFEHAWGNFSYTIGKNPLSNLKDMMEKLPQLLHLARWFFSEQSRQLLDSYKFSTDNVFGYDWSWATFDNGWSLYFGAFHILNFVSEGKVFGLLSFTQDGQTIWDFADVKIKYTKRFYIPEADVYLPLDIEVNANKGDKKLFLRFTSTTEPHKKSIAIYPQSKALCGSAGIQTAGVVSGYYQDKDQRVHLHGNCTIGPFRSLLLSKNNEIDLEFDLPPEGLGFSFKFKSNFLGFEMFFKRQWKPYFERRFYIKPVGLPYEIYNNEPKAQNIDSLTLYVGGDGPNNYSKIQDAINDAYNGDTVFVYNGKYYENLLINKSIHLIGESKELVYLNPGNKDGIKTVADNVEIKGFTIDMEEADSYDDSAIDLSSSYNLVHDNNIIKSEWYGIFIFNSTGNIIENNSIIDNDIGIWICRSYKNIIHYNNISLSKWVGIWLWPYSIINTISNNNFLANKINSENSDKICRNNWDRNYWDDYVGLKHNIIVDLNNDGIGSIGYRISRLNWDWNPLMEPYKL